MMAPPHDGAGRMVLMVDDDPDVRTSVARGLRHSGFDVRVAANGKEALRLLSNESHDALVLDVQMPELDGVAVVTALRALGNDIPICVLSARDTVNDRIAGLEAGADDYLTKPFDLGELVARLHALLRRSSHSDRPSDTMTVGPLTIDTARRLVFVDGERAELTKREFDLLAVLAENAGVVLSQAAAARVGVGLRLRRRHQRRRRVHQLSATQAGTRRAPPGDPHRARDRLRPARRTVAAAWCAFLGSAGRPRFAPASPSRRRSRRRPSWRCSPS